MIGKSNIKFFRLAGGLMTLATGLSLVYIAFVQADDARIERRYWPAFCCVLVAQWLGVATGILAIAVGNGGIRRSPKKDRLIIKALAFGCFIITGIEVIAAAIILG